MVRKTRGCVGGSLLFLLVTLFASPVSADESSTHGEEYHNLWASNVEQALQRVRAEEQLATSNDQQVLAAVRANLAATLALYESPDEPLPPPPMLDRVPTARVYLAAEEQEVQSSRWPREERTRRDDARPREQRERRDVESESDDAGEESRDDSAARQREEMISRFQEMRQRMEGGRRSTRNDEPARLAPPHPRIVNALQTQQEQLEQLSTRIERLERRLRELQSERPRADRDTPLVDRELPRDEIRGRIQVETRRRERQIDEARRAAEDGHRDSLISRRVELTRREAQITNARNAARIALEQARQKVQIAELEVQRKSQELERLEQATSELRREMSRMSDEERAVDEVRRRDRRSELPRETE
ncbi:hypothetical protein [Aeoliella sp. SH292]|uniref:hypothetical protein n=1 Tax=Aeoliella sp. SH292 TaxID=3454464 RepID=UPI003F957853